MHRLSSSLSSFSMIFCFVLQPPPLGRGKRFQEVSGRQRVLVETGVFSSSVSTKVSNGAAKVSNIAVKVSTVVANVSLLCA